MAKLFSSTLRTIEFLKRYWFLTALLAISLTTVESRSDTLYHIGRFIKNNHGPDIIMACIFMLSGFTLSIQKVREGLLDFRGTLLALGVIFLVAPIWAAVFGLLPLDPGIVKGLFLVSVMPSTLSSGVVMTAAAGGNAAHALVVTIISNSLATFTIPLSLTTLLRVFDQAVSVHVDNIAIILKIFYLAVLPLCAGMACRRMFSSLILRWEKEVVLTCQLLVLLVVWVAISQTGEVVSNGGMKVIVLLLVVAAYHGLLLGSCWGIIRLSGRTKGNRESILFIGGQKTLPLSIVLQMAIFPDSGMVLLVCVLHQIVHLVMDGYLVERIKVTL